MVEGGFDELDMDDFDVDKIEDYSYDQLTDNYADLVLEMDRLQKRYGNNEETPENIRVKYKDIGTILDVINNEKERRDETDSNSSDEKTIGGEYTTIGGVKSYLRDKEYEKNNKTPAESTSWIDEDLYYKQRDEGVLREIGTKDNIKYFINELLRRGDTDIGKYMSSEKRFKAIKFIRSFLAIADGGGSRPLLDSEDGIKLIKSISFSRGGSVKFGGLTTTLIYNGVDVREVNTGNFTVKKLGIGTTQEKEYTRLVNSVLGKTEETIEEISSDSQLNTKVVKEIVNGDNWMREMMEKYPADKYVTPPSPEVIEAIAGEKTAEPRTGEKTAKAGEKLNSLRKDITDLSFSNGEQLASGTTHNTDVSKLDNIVIPDSVVGDIVVDSVRTIQSRLHEREQTIESLVVSDQELREFSGILNPKGTPDTKIAALEIASNEYRLKALREAEPRKERLYKNIHETAELKMDLIYIAEKGDPPINREATEIIREEIENNESVNDLSRLETFKKWAKENMAGLAAIAISIAGIITTVMLSARSVITKGATATSKFAKAVYKTFKEIAKKLGPVLGPVLSAIGSILATVLKYGAKGLAWLSQNLWILVIALAWLAYDSISKKRRK